MNDKVYISAPIDKTATLVVQKDNSRQIDGKDKWLQYMSLVRPPIRNNPFSNKAHDITGLRVGNFTVIGMFIKQNKNKNAHWVVQCDCGYFTLRRAKTINGYKDFQFKAKCESCHYKSNLSKAIL